MSKIIVVALIGAVVGGAMIDGATLVLAQQDAIALRQENRNQASAATRAIKGIIDAKGPTSGAVRHAAKLKELQAAFATMFPVGSDPASSNRRDTKALPTIWSDMAGFQAASKAAEAAYDTLAVAAGSGDLAALTAAWSNTGKACGACHDKYRAQ